MGLGIFKAFFYGTALALGTGAVITYATAYYLDAWAPRKLARAIRWVLPFASIAITYPHRETVSNFAPNRWLRENRLLRQKQIAEAIAAAEKAAQEGGSDSPHEQEGGSDTPPEQEKVD